MKGSEGLRRPNHHVELPPVILVSGPHVAGRNEHMGRVRELFARDFPTVYQAINDLKRKDHRQLAYLLQAHESKLMIDLICRKLLEEMPGTFVATIHDSILTIPDKADQIRAVMVERVRAVRAQADDQDGGLLNCWKPSGEPPRQFPRPVGDKRHLVSERLRSHRGWSQIKPSKVAPFE